MKSIKKLWDSIAVFETKERKHESKDTLLSEARAGARMEAYVRLMELEIRNETKPQ